MSDMIITTPKVPSTSFSSGKTNHSKLSNLDFDNSGHTGFQRELTEVQLENINNVPNKADADKVYTKTEIDEKIGDIESALIDLHSYAQSLVGGEAV